jgi:hypothetical protein
MTIPTIGRVAIVQAPSGSVTGWITPAGMDDDDDGGMDYGIHD